MEIGANSFAGKQPNAAPFIDKSDATVSPSHGKPSIPDALAPLITKPFWCCWRWKWTGNRWTKPPLQATIGLPPARNNFAATWADGDTALETATRHGIGIGLMLGNLQGVAVIDLDNCIDPETGKAASWAEDIIKRAGSYAERSPSGTGFKIFGTSDVATFGKRKVKRPGGEIEVFSQGAYYMCVTGQPETDSRHLADITELVSQLVAEADVKAKPEEPCSKANGASSYDWSQHRFDDGEPNLHDIQRALKGYWDFDDYHDWVNAGLALDHLGDEGKQLWWEWSQKSTKFNAVKAEKKWEETKSNGEITYRSVLNKVPKDVLSNWGKERAQERANEQLLEDFGPEGVGGNEGDSSAGTNEARADKPGTENSQKANAGKFTPPSRESLIITSDELEAARLAPDCIVEDYLFADLAQTVAAGGVGKTTLMAHQCICIALGIDLFGLEVKKTGWTLFITAEDQRERLVARTREIMNHMMLDDAQQKKACESVLIWDVTGNGLKLTRAIGNNLETAPSVQAIIEAYKADPPVMVVVDPLISFGVSEALVNDNEQALVAAGRALIKHFNCCVHFIHHTGKANAREKTEDQYSGRGGSALADGSRMTFVLNPVKPDKLPDSIKLEDGDTVVKLNRAKMSYCAPQPPIYIVRGAGGYTFRHEYERTRSEEAILKGQMMQMVNFIRHKLGQGIYLNKTNIEEGYLSDLGMNKREARMAIERCLVEGKLVELPLPESERHGRRKVYLAPVEGQEGAE